MKANLPLEPHDDFRERSLEFIRDATIENRMKPARSLDYYFPNTDEMRDGHIHVLVSTHEVEEMADALVGGIYYLRKSVRRHAFLSRPSLSPSGTVKDPKRCVEVFGKTIHVDRFPVALFSPILASLCKDLNKLDDIQPDPRAVRSASLYARAVLRVYETEDMCQLAISPSVASIFGTPDWNACIPWADYMKASAVWTTSFGSTIPYMLWELKTIAGSSGDPLLQAAVGYAKIVSSTEAVSACEDRTNFPMILLGIAGRRLQLAAAVFTGSIYVSKLITLDLGLGLNVDSHIITLARVFDCIRKCQLRLHRYYSELFSQPLQPTFCSAFPNPTPVNSSVTLPSITYHGFISNETGAIVADLTQMNQGTTARYYATLEDDTKVVVKLASRYNANAHKLLADAGFAPALYFCEEVVGGAFMVVMEWVDAKPLAGRIPPIVLDKVADAVEILHAKDIVFGDLREQNILYDASSRRLALVDFDWADKDGEGRYPPHVMISGLGLRWASGVEPFGVMMKEHDLWQIQRMRREGDEQHFY
ncbi:hypothetical protein CPC08DRAFT_714403 [Agrocybe pediades]|nr:hypothetical protein CPC08DRAFT_714403 [Agrocybe pediades]